MQMFLQTHPQDRSTLKLSYLLIMHSNVSNSKKKRTILFVHNILRLMSASGENWLGDRLLYPLKGFFSQFCLLLTTTYSEQFLMLHSARSNCLKLKFHSSKMLWMHSIRRPMNAADRLVCIKWESIKRESQIAVPSWNSSNFQPLNARIQCIRLPGQSISIQIYFLLFNLIARLAASIVLLALGNDFRIFACLFIRLSICLSLY